MAKSPGRPGFSKDNSLRRRLQNRCGPKSRRKIVKVEIHHSAPDVGTLASERIIARPDEPLAAEIEHGEVVVFLVGPLVVFIAQAGVNRQLGRQLDVVLKVIVLVGLMHVSRCGTQVTQAGTGQTQQIGSQGRSRTRHVLGIRGGNFVKVEDGRKQAVIQVIHVLQFEPHPDRVFSADH